MTKTAKFLASLKSFRIDKMEDWTKITGAYPNEVVYEFDSVGELQEFEAQHARSQPQAEPVPHKE